MDKRRILSIAAVVALFLGIINTLFTVDETKQALVLQLGTFIREIKDPGLHVKIPFMQEVVQYERRLLRLDAPPSTYFSKDKKQLIVDAYARYYVTDPLLFFRALRTEGAARARVDDLVTSNLRQEFARDNQSDIIKGERNAITQRVTEATRGTAREFGIEVVDVRIKRVEFPDEIALSIYGRMNAEREKEALKFRSEGREEEVKIKAQAEKERAILLAEATRKAQELRGEGEAQAVEIYARALEQDPEFFAFQRSLEAYKSFLKSDATVVLSSQSDLFRYLANPGGVAPSP